MLHRYRILGAILALRKFTVADLVHYTGAKEDTVRTVLARESRFVEKVGVQAGRRRGGQAIRYEVCGAKEEELVAILRALETVTVTPARLGVTTGPDGGQDGPGTALATLTLVAAEDILLRQLPQTDPAERAPLLDLATADYETAQSVAVADQREAVIHLELVGLLIRLSQVEQEVCATLSDADGGSSQLEVFTETPGSPAMEKQLDGLQRDLYQILPALAELSDKDLVRDVFYRIGGSILAPVLLRRPVLQAA
jgi:hypothetical protein